MGIGISSKMGSNFQTHKNSMLKSVGLIHTKWEEKLSENSTIFRLSMRIFFILSLQANVKRGKARVRRVRKYVFVCTYMYACIYTYNIYIYTRIQYICVCTYTGGGETKWQSRYICKVVVVPFCRYLQAAFTPIPLYFMELSRL